MNVPVMEACVEGHKAQLMPRDSIVFDGLCCRPQLRIAEVMRDAVVLEIVQPVAIMYQPNSSHTYACNQHLTKHMHVSKNSGGRKTASHMRHYYYTSMCHTWRNATAKLSAGALSAFGAQITSLHHHGTFWRCGACPLVDMMHSTRWT